MQEVTQDRFYDSIGNRDVICKVNGPYPYTIDFKLRHGPVVGQKIESYLPGYTAGPTETRYYIAD